MNPYRVAENVGRGCLFIAIAACVLSMLVLLVIVDIRCGWWALLMPPTWIVPIFLLAYFIEACVLWRERKHQWNRRAWVRPILIRKEQSNDQ